MKKILQGKAVKASLVVLFLAILAGGIFRDELPDIVANATIICYSCIGLK